VVRDGDEIRFCHRLQTGAADRSYGIEAARLAGLPPAVLARARELQLEMETARLVLKAENRETAATKQMSLFGDEKEEVCKRLAALKLSEITPIEAMNWLAASQARLREAQAAPHHMRNRRR
jgi:DNA mismatch repair protein MutS